MGVLEEEDRSGKSKARKRGLGPIMLEPCRTWRNSNLQLRRDCKGLSRELIEDNVSRILTIV